MSRRVSRLFAISILVGAVSAPAQEGGAPADSEVTVVGIVAHRYAWVTQYPGPDGRLGRFHESLVTETNPQGRDLEDPAGKDDILSIGTEIVVPADRPVVVHGTSVDNLHGFTVKAYKLDEPLVPGSVRRFTFQPRKAGKAQILCANYCGEGHDEMKGTLRILERAEFDEWLKGQAAGSGVGAKP